MSRLLANLAVVLAGAASLIGPLAAAPAARADSGLEALTTGDLSKGWEAVGRLNLGQSGFCTGTLIAPDKVLTAAHCLFDKATGERFPIARMQFLADWRMGRAAAYRNIRRAVPAPGYVYGSSDKLNRVRHDLALIELDRPIRMPSIRPFRIGSELAAGESVGVVSYAQDRAEAPSLQQSCHALDRQSGFFVLSCDIDFGSSGAPVFAMRNGVPQIVSVISAKADADGKSVALGVDVAEQLKALEQRLVQFSSGTVLQTEGAGLPGVLTLGHATGRAGGAKFVKP